MFQRLSLLVVEVETIGVRRSVVPDRINKGLVNCVDLFTVQYRHGINGRSILLLLDLFVLCVVGN